MILWNIVPPVIQDATYTKYMYQHSKQYVGVGSWIKGGNNVAEAKNRKCGFLLVVVLYLITVFFGIFFVLFCMKFDKFLFFFLL